MAGIEEAFEKFSDRLAREESKRYSRDEQGDYVEEVQDPYPIKLGPLELGANANMSTGKFSPDEYQNISTMNRNVGLRGKYNVPNSGIALLGSIGDVRSSSQNKLNLPFNPMTGEAEPYSETMKNVYKDSPYSVGAQYNPQGTDEMYSALYNKGGGYNLGYNKGPVNVSYTSNPGLGNNVMLRGQYNFEDGGRAGYETGGDVSEEQSLINKILGQIKIGGDFANKNKNDPFNKFGFGERDTKDPRIGIEYIMKPEDERSSKIGISVGPKGGGISFMKPFSEKLNEEKNEDVVQTYIDFARNVWGVEVTEQEARKALGIYDMPDTSIRNELPPEEKAYGGRVSMSDGGLTTTVPPDKGPDSQGVESLFRRRYS